MSDPGLTFLHCRHDPACTAVVDKHFVGYCSLQLITRGRVQLSYDDRRHTLGRRWAWLCYPGPHIRFHPCPGEPSWEHRYVAFTGPLLARWREAGLLGFEAQRAPDDETYVPRFHRLVELARRHDVVGRLRAINLLEGVLLELHDLRHASAEVPWLEGVKERLAAQNTLWPDYAALAADLNVGLSTLRRRFRAAAGTSLHQYVLRRRAQEAMALLGDTSLPVKAIAGRLGYRDTYFFSKQFRAVTGTTPGGYRKSRQA